MSLCLIASPAKKMNEVDGPPNPSSVPCFIDEADLLRRSVRSLSYAEAKALWKCSDEIAELNFERFQHMKLDANLTAAILAYEGIQYTSIAAGVLDGESLSWLNDHFRIISGMYGLLRPLDGIVSYRLEMQAKLGVGQNKNLYEFWGEKICAEIAKDFDTIIDVASIEYSKAVVHYATRFNVHVVSCKFGYLREGRFTQVSTEAKAARGSFARWCAENKVATIMQLNSFSERGYRYMPDLSSATEMIFVRD